MSLARTLEILKRAHAGPVISLEEWDVKRIPAKVREKLQKYELVKTFTPDDPVNMDNELADRFFQAGYEMAHELGVYCTDTERVIEVTEGELNEVVSQAPQELVMGQGKDQVIMRARRPDDDLETLCSAPVGIVVSEKDWVPVSVGIALVEEIDIFQGGSFDTVYGVPLRGGTPFETLAGRLQAQLTHEALQQAGRPGMPIAAVCTSPTAFGQLGGFGVTGGFSIDQTHALILATPEMKVSYDILHKVVHAVGMGARNEGGSPPMIGGFAGPPEGAAIAGIAWSLMQYLVLQADYGAGAPMDIRLNCNTNRTGLWSMSMMMQALSRNTDLLIQTLPNQLGGPMTEMLLWESLAALSAVVASGTSVVKVPRTSGGKYANHLSPLECKFCAEVVKASAGLSREAANEIVKEVLPRYEDKLSEPDIGVTFPECYDVDSLTPLPEWQDIYDKIKNGAIKLGMPLKQ